MDSTQQKQNSTKTIIYMYASAFTDCDCGQNLILSQKVVGSQTYSGRCSCGLAWTLANGKIHSFNPFEVVAA